MFKWLKNLMKDNAFEVGDEITEDVESWEKPKSYRILEVGKRQYRLMELSGYEDPYRRPDDYISSKIIWYVDRRFRKITISISD